MSTSLSERMRRYVDRKGDNECWEWMQFRDKRTRYGIVGDGQKTKKAHRVAWELANGRSVPEGMNVLHRCDNPPCCNPAHLFLGTQADNVRDMAQKGRCVVPGISGQRHYAAKISDKDADYIRASTERGVDLAARFGLSPSTVCQIRKGQRRKKVAA